MRNRLDAAINGRWLTDVDDAVTVVDIEEHAPEADRPRVTMLDGSTRLLPPRGRTLAVTVRFLLREKQPPRRRHLLDLVHAWAADGCLTLRDRPGQRLWVKADGLCGMRTAAEQTEEVFALRFTADTVPYWEDEGTYTVNGETLYTSSGTVARTLPCTPRGTAPSMPVCVTVLTAGCGGQISASVHETGDTVILLAPAGSQTMVCIREEDGILLVENGAGQSLAHLLSPSCSDRLRVLGGAENHITVTTAAPCGFQLSGRGWYC